MKYVSYSFYKKIFIVTALFILIGSFNFASAAVKFGDVGEEVREVQVCLIAQELLNGEADGICGKATVQAIKDFQVAVGLPVDGICGMDTYAALENAPYDDTSDSYVLKESIENLPRVQKTIKVDATAYSIQESGVGYHTAMGTPVRHGVIAVDPIFIPLGTHVFIPGYGEAIAEDTGGDIVGYRIDIAFDSYYEALEFGRQILEIYVLEE